MPADDSGEFETRTIVVPLGNAIKGIPRIQRAAKAINVIRRTVAKAMKESESAVWIFDDVNEAVWARGRERPPVKLVVIAERIDDGQVEVRLPAEGELEEDEA